MLSYFINLFTSPRNTVRTKRRKKEPKGACLDIGDLFNALYFRLSFQVSIQSNGFPRGIFMHMYHSTFPSPTHLLPSHWLLLSPFRPCFCFSITCPCIHAHTTYTYVISHLDSAVRETMQYYTRVRLTLLGVMTPSYIIFLHFETE